MGQFALHDEKRNDFCEAFEFFLSVYIPKNLTFRHRASSI